MLSSILEHSVLELLLDRGHGRNVTIGSGVIADRFLLVLISFLEIL